MRLLAAAVLWFLLAACSGPVNPTPSAASYRAAPFELQIGNTVEKVNGASVTMAFFQETKAAPLLGRLFLETEFQTGGTCVAVMGATLWQRKLGGDPSVLGKVFGVNGQPCTLVGILPKSFQVPAQAELWLPQIR